MQQQGGSQYGVPPSEMAPPFVSNEAGMRMPRMIGIPGGVQYMTEAADPISSRPGPQQPVVQRQQVSIFEDFGSGGGAVGGGFPDEESLAAGEDAERGGGSGNRWPRQETLALLKIRSEMDAAFRDATLKGPLWEDVSRKLAELGYGRNAKKCKEKFENVHKYYKRTKEGRAGRQDGKSYRFFTQLEALHSTTSLAVTATGAPAAASVAVPSSIMPAAPPLAGRILSPAATAPAPRAELITPAAVAGISFSSSSSSASETDGEETEEGVGDIGVGSRKRKREGWQGGGSRKMMAFFDGLMKQVMERQEAMQQRFIDTIEKREQDRMIREEAWKRQEMARLNREYELMAQERTMAANRDAAVISFLQKFTGSPLPTHPAPEPSPEAALRESPQQQQNIPPAEAPPRVEPPPMQIQANVNLEINEVVVNQLSVSSEPASTAGAALEMADIISPSSSATSRWPKMEVLDLIKLRSALETRYLEAGPKGPLWEEISHAMKGLGYSRNAKRCKEKWENINKYFKKVKESNKKRPEDAKTCPYFHELDALYRKKQLFASPAAGIIAPPLQQTSNPQQIGESPQTPAPISRPIEQESSNGAQMPRRNVAGIPQLFFSGAPNRSGAAAAVKKPEDIVRELIGHQNQPRRVANDHYDKLTDSVDSDTINHEYDDDEENYDEDDEEEDDGNLRYEIQFQRQAVVGAASGGVRAGNGSATGKVPTTTTTSAGSFLAMVQ